MAQWKIASFSLAAVLAAFSGQQVHACSVVAFDRPATQWDLDQIAKSMVASAAYVQIAEARAFRQYTRHEVSAARRAASVPNPTDEWLIKQDFLGWRVVFQPVRTLKGPDSNSFELDIAVDREPNFGLQTQTYRVGSRSVGSPIPSNWAYRTWSPTYLPDAADCPKYYVGAVPGNTYLVFRDKEGRLMGQSFEGETGFVFEPMAKATSGGWLRAVENAARPRGARR